MDAYAYIHAWYTYMHMLMHDGRRHGWSSGTAAAGAAAGRIAADRIDWMDLSLSLSLSTYGGGRRPCREAIHPISPLYGHVRRLLIKCHPCISPYLTLANASADAIMAKLSIFVFSSSSCYLWVHCHISLENMSSLHTYVCTKVN